MRIGRVCLLTLLASSACTTRMDVQVVRYPEAAELAPREPGCEVQLLDWSAEPAASCRDLGDVFVGDPGWLSVSCGRESAEATIRVEACRLGANVALSRAITDWDSLCYPMRARLLRCEDMRGAPL